MGGISGMRGGGVAGGGTERCQIGRWTFCELGISCNGLVKRCQVLENICGGTV